MTSLFRVTVVAESDQPVAEARVRSLFDEVAAGVASAPPADGDDPVVVRSDQQGFTLLLLVEAESSDDAVRDVEAAARAAMEGVSQDDGTRLEQVRAEPAFTP